MRSIIKAAIEIMDDINRRKALADKAGMKAESKRLEKQHRVVGQVFLDIRKAG